MGEDVLSYARIRPAVLQVEIHPYFRNEKLVKWCRMQGIHVTAFSPLGSPDSAVMLRRKVSTTLMDDPVVKALAEKYNRNVGQVLLRWALQERPDCSILPKSVSEARIRSNLDGGALGWE